MKIEDEEQFKRILKEVVNEWLQDKFAQFGRWSFYGLMASALVAVVYLILWTNGWRHS